MSHHHQAAQQQQPESQLKPDVVKRHNRQAHECLWLLAQQTRNLTATVFHQQLLKTHQQVVCDLLLHQQLFSALLCNPRRLVPGHQQDPAAANLPAAFSALQPCGHSCAFCHPARQHLQEQQGDQCTASGAAEQQLSPWTPGPRQQPDDQHRLGGSFEEELLLPNSYVSRLLLSADKQQLRQATSMTARGFAAFFADLMPQMLMVLEMSTRHQATLSHSSSSSSSAAVSSFIPVGQSSTAHAAAAAHAAAVAQGAAAMHPSSSQQVAPGACSGGCGCGGTPARNSPDGSHNNAAAGSAAAAKGGSAAAEAPRPAAAAAAAAAAAPCRGPAMLDALCPEAHPAGSCPVMDLSRLLGTVDRAMTVVLLGLLHNHLPLLQASAVSFSSGQACAAGMQHWQLVAQRLELTEEQEVHLAACMEEYQRQSRLCRDMGAALSADVEAPSLYQVLQQAEQSRSRAKNAQQQQHAGAAAPGCGIEQQQYPTRGSAAAGTRRSSRVGKRAAHADWSAEAAAREAAAAAPQSCKVPEACSLQELHQKLQAYVRSQHMQLLSLVSVVANTLSQTQLATAFVASYPFAPDFLAIAAAASYSLQLRQELGLWQIEQAVLQRELTKGDGTGAAEEGAAAGAAASKPPAGRGRRQGKPSTTKVLAAAGSVVAAVAGAGGAAGSDSDGSGTAGQQAKLPKQQQQPVQLLQSVTKQHMQQRTSRLEAHQALCCAELEQPGDNNGPAQLQPAGQQPAWAGCGTAWPMAEVNPFQGQAACAGCT